MAVHRLPFGWVQPQGIKYCLWHRRLNLRQIPLSTNHCWHLRRLHREQQGLGIGVQIVGVFHVDGTRGHKGTHPAALHSTRITCFLPSCIRLCDHFAARRQGEHECAKQGFPHERMCTGNTPYAQGGLGQADETKFGSPAAFQFASFSVTQGSAPAAPCRLTCWKTEKLERCRLRSSPPFYRCIRHKMNKSPFWRLLHQWLPFRTRQRKGHS